MFASGPEPDVPTPEDWRNSGNEGHKSVIWTNSRFITALFSAVNRTSGERFMSRVVTNPKRRASKTPQRVAGEKAWIRIDSRRVLREASGGMRLRGTTVKRRTAR